MTEAVGHASLFSGADGVVASVVGRVHGVVATGAVIAAFLPIALLQFLNKTFHSQIYEEFISCNFCSFNAKLKISFQEFPNANGLQRHLKVQMC